MLINIFACPKCNGKLRFRRTRLECFSCTAKYPLRSSIPLFAQSDDLSPVLKMSQSEYNKIHLKPWDKLHDGSIEILATFARGNKTLDVACGDGYVEQLAPHAVGLDFSLSALLKAQKNGARNLVQATAESLPFKDNVFDLVICAGSLEHFQDPEKAISEMARVGKIQLLTVHSSVPGHYLLSKILAVKHQPIEKPIGMKKLQKMLTKSGLKIVFKGVWTLPLNYGRVIKILPELKAIPSNLFIISVKK